MTPPTVGVVAKPPLFSSLRFRIVATFVLALALLLSALVFLVVQVQRFAEEQALIVEGYLPLSLTIDQMRQDQDRVEEDVRRLLAGDERPGRGGASAAVLYTERFREAMLTGRIHARQASQMANGAQEVAVLRKVQVQLMNIEALLKPYRSGARELVRLAESGQDVAELEGLWQQSGRSMSAELDTLDRLVAGRIRALTDDAEAGRRQAVVIALAMAFGALVLSILLVGAVLLALAPVGRLTAQVQRMAAGDYSERAERWGNDEISLLAGEFNKLAEAIEGRDRTLVRRAEELDRLTAYLTSVLDSLQESLFVVESGGVSLANPAARDWQIERSGELPPLFQRLLSGGNSQEFSKDDRHYALRWMPFQDDGKVVTVQDVTATKQASERLARSERLAMVGQMLAQITHEVRNPLNAMSLNAEMLAEEIGALDPDQQTEASELLETVSREIERLTEVTGHYLQLARRPKANIQVDHLTIVIDEIVRLVQAELDAAQVQLRVSVDVPDPVRMDGNQIRQALLNVIRNAVEAGASRLQLSAVQTPIDTQVCLQDDGPGMAPSELERAVDPFFSTKASGTGLGLAITRQILEDHDGSLRITSDRGEGTTMTLVWPR